MSRNKRRFPHVGLALERLARQVTEWTGGSWAFGVAVGVIIVWALTGPFFGFSDTWQLVINTGTTIVTFLMVFLIQRSQNKDAQAVHLKLNEISPRRRCGSCTSTMRDSSRSPSATEI